MKTEFELGEEQISSSEFSSRPFGILICQLIRKHLLNILL